MSGVGKNGKPHAGKADASDVFSQEVGGTGEGRSELEDFRFLADDDDAAPEPARAPKDDTCLDFGALSISGPLLPAAPLPKPEPEPEVYADEASESAPAAERQEPAEPDAEDLTEEPSYLAAPIAAPEVPEVYADEAAAAESLAPPVDAPPAEVEDATLQAIAAAQVTPDVAQADTLQSQPSSPYPAPIPAAIPAAAPAAAPHAAATAPRTGATPIPETVLAPPPPKTTARRRFALLAAGVALGTLGLVASSWFTDREDGSGSAPSQVAATTGDTLPTAQTGPAQTLNAPARSNTFAVPDLGDTEAEASAPRVAQTLAQDADGSGEQRASTGSSRAPQPVAMAAQEISSEPPAAQVEIVAITGGQTETSPVLAAQRDQAGSRVPRDPAAALFAASAETTPLPDLAQILARGPALVAATQIGLSLPTFDVPQDTGAFAAAAGLADVAATFAAPRIEAATRAEDRLASGAAPEQIVISAVDAALSGTDIGEDTTPALRPDAPVSERPANTAIAMAAAIDDTATSLRLPRQVALQSLAPSRPAVVENDDPLPQVRAEAPVANGVAASPQIVTAALVTDTVSPSALPQQITAQGRAPALAEAAVSIEAAPEVGAGTRLSARRPAVNRLLVARLSEEVTGPRFTVPKPLPARAGAKPAQNWTTQIAAQAAPALPAPSYRVDNALEDDGDAIAPARPDALALAALPASGGGPDVAASTPAGQPQRITELPQAAPVDPQTTATSGAPARTEPYRAEIAALLETEAAVPGSAADLALASLEADTLPSAIPNPSRPVDAEFATGTSFWRPDLGFELEETGDKAGLRILAATAQGDVPAWAVGGGARITAANGWSVGTLNGFKSAMANTYVDPKSAKGRILLKVAQDGGAEDTVEYDATFVRSFTTAGGTVFESRFDGRRWVTQVAASGRDSDLLAGDIVVRDFYTKEKFSYPTASERVIGWAAENGEKAIRFAILRGDAIGSATITSDGSSFIRAQ